MSQGPAGKARFCTSHPNQEIDLLCLDCDVPLCAHCFVLFHAGHGVKRFIDRVGQLEQDLAAETEKVRARESSLSRRFTGKREGFSGSMK